MPALPSVPKVIRVVLVHSYGIDLGVITRFYVQYTGTAPTSANLTSWGTAIGSAWNTNMAPQHNAIVHLTNIEMTDLSSSTSAQATVNVSYVGTLAGNQLPADTCVVTSYTITRRYRGGKPRGYWPGGSTGVLATPQSWTAAYATAFDAALQAFQVAIFAAPWSGSGTLAQVNVSYYQGHTAVQDPITLRWRNVPVLRTTPLVDVVLAHTSRQRIGSQRRRLNPG